MAKPRFKLESRVGVAAIKCSHRPEQAESLVGKNGVHADMFTTQVSLQKIKKTRMLREREDLVARVREASEKSGVGNGAEKVRASILPGRE